MKTIRKTKTNLLMVGCITTMTMMTMGCSKDNPLNPAGACFGGNWAEQYADELQAWSNAASVYTENPTLGNCNEYKNAAKAYLDALNEIYDCVPTANRAEIDKAVNEAKADIDNEGCD
jgi:hypothetical protein